MEADPPAAAVVSDKSRLDCGPAEVSVPGFTDRLMAEWGTNAVAGEL